MLNKGHFDSIDFTISFFRKAWKYIFKVYFILSMLKLFHFCFNLFCLKYLTECLFLLFLLFASFSSSLNFLMLPFLCLHFSHSLHLFNFFKLHWHKFSIDFFLILLISFSTLIVLLHNYSSLSFQFLILSFLFVNSLFPPLFLVLPNCLYPFPPHFILFLSLFFCASDIIHFVFFVISAIIFRIF